MRTLSSIAAIAVGLVLLAPNQYADVIDNRGTEFFLGFMHNYTGTPNLVLFITGPAATTGSVAVPGLAFHGDAWNHHFCRDTCRGHVGGK